MKARIKKLGHNPIRHNWVKIGATFEVTDVDVNDGLYGSFKLTVPNAVTSIFCLISNCSFIGGSGSEWEILDSNYVDISDAYDRAMGIL